MALDNGYHFAAQTLPTPTDTPYDSPFMGVSRQSSRRGSLSSFSVDSPIPFPPGQDSYFSKQQGITDDSNADGASAHDSPRFTPNNQDTFLVAQIQSLRTELVYKDNTIEDLEECLHRSRAETEQLTKDLKTQKAEVTSVKNQMQSLEKGMLQALEDMAKERDSAVENISDTRRRLEDSKNRARIQEENASKAHSLWEKDRQNWDDERRKLEGRVHIVENRLKTLVTEMLLVQNADQQSPAIGDLVDDGVKSTSLSTGDDTSSVRCTSYLSNKGVDESCEAKDFSNFRPSRLIGLHDLGGSQMSGVSLADELELDAGENTAEENIDHDTLPEEVYTLNRPYSEDKKIRKANSLHADTGEEPLGDETSGQHSIGIINDYIDFPETELGSHCTNTGIQLSPHPSPSQQPQDPGSLEVRVEQTECAANQRRKRIAIPQIFVEQTSAFKPAEPKNLHTVSSGNQTIGQLGVFASMAKAANATSGPACSTTNEMTSASTQTVDDPQPLLKPANSRLPYSPIDVPVIAIHPPASRPSSSRNSVMLPPRTKNVACQVELPRNTKSVSMQTEEARIGEGPVNIPLSLLSSDLPTQHLPTLTERCEQAAETSGGDPSNIGLQSPPPMKAEGKRSGGTTARNRYAHSGNNDNGPLNYNQPFGPKRPIRSGSISAGFDVPSDDEPESTQYRFSDDELLNAPPIRKTLSKVQNSWRLVPHLKDSVLERLESAPVKADDENHASVPKAAILQTKASSQATSKNSQTRPAESYRIPRGEIKQPDFRRKALISKSILEYAQRSSGLSELNVSGNEATNAPPFPVPTRSSSRHVPLNASDGAASPSPHATTFFNVRRDQNFETPLAKRRMLRKVQSAAAVARPSVPLRPQPAHSLSASPSIPSSLKSFEKRRNEPILPYDSVADLRNHSAHSQARVGKTLAETSSEQSSISDMIAQTMVGEWMWKYVRKRISFGITENPQAELDSGRNGDSGNSNGIRHKRWVWLAPSEGAVMWSSKQPVSGPVLLGKGTRKLIIQSVLDVKDDTPLPKNADPPAVFNRSILILTPQRALKFTATSRERHYSWLTALSYLSNATQGIDDLTILPPSHQQDYQYTALQEPTIGFGRMPIGDSISTEACPSIGGQSLSSPIGLIAQEIFQGAKLSWDDEKADSNGAAEAPQVHRVAAHTRRRSSTGPRLAPLNAFRIYSNNALAVASSYSLHGATSREKYDRKAPQPQAGSVANTTHGTLTRDTTNSEIALSPAAGDHFCDSAGTIRMEAFVKGKEKEGVRRKRGKSYRIRQGRRKDMGFWGFDTAGAGSGVESARRKWEDPFTGF